MREGLAQPESDADRTMGWLVAGSLGLNLVLAGWLVHPVDHRASAGEVPSPHGPSVSIAASVQRVTRAEAGATALTPAPPFQWSEIESTSYPEYIARLRAVGCPESVIRDIVSADIGQLYSSRARQIWNPPERPYWQKQREMDRPGPDQLNKLMQLDAERKDLQKELLGSATLQQEMIDLVFLQVHGAEQKLAWLPEDRRAAALAALDRSGYSAEEEKELMSPVHGESLERMKELEKKQLAILEGVLAPDELKEFKMRTSHEADTLRSELRYFDATEAEFDAIVAWREKVAQEKPVNRDYYARKAEESAAARQLFGDERGLEYERNTDLFYNWSRQAAERYGLPEDVAAQAWTVKRDTLAAADQVRRDSTLADPEKQRRLTDLQTQAEAKLDTVLGASAARMARRGDGAWLTILPQRLQP